MAQLRDRGELGWYSQCWWWGAGIATGAAAGPADRDGIRPLSAVDTGVRVTLADRKPSAVLRAVGEMTGVAHPPMVYPYCLFRVVDGTPSRCRRTLSRRG